MKNHTECLIHVVLIDMDKESIKLSSISAASFSSYGKCCD